MGQNIIDELIRGIGHKRRLIENGDIEGLINLFENVGSPGYRNLASTTSDPCLQPIFLLLAEVNAFLAYLLQCIRDPNEAAELVCNALSYKAQRINSCCAPTPYVVLVQTKQMLSSK